MEPPDPDDDFSPPTRQSTGTIITIAVIVVLLVIMVALHLAGARPSH